MFMNPGNRAFPRIWSRDGLDAVLRIDNIERMRINASGNANIGNRGTTVASSFSNMPLLQVTSFTTGNIGNFAAHKYTADVFAPMLNFFKSRGTTAGSFTAVASGDFIGVINCTATDGTSIQECASIAMVVEGAVSAGTVPTYMIFRTAISGGGSERVRIDSNGRVIIGGSASQAGIVGTQPVFQTQGATGQNTQIGFYGWNNNPPQLYINNSRGASIGTHSGLSSTDIIGDITWGIDDGTNFQPGTIIEGHVDGTVSAGVAPGRFQFYTNSGSGAVERMRISKDGYCNIGNAGANIAGGLGANVMLQICTTSTQEALSIHRYTTDTSAPYMGFIKSRGTTVGSVTAVASGDRLGYIGFAGTDGTSVIDAGNIQMFVDGTVSTNVMPTRLVIQTCQTNAQVERWRIDNLGILISGGAASVASVFGDIPIVQINNKSDATRGELALHCWTNDANSPNFFLCKSRGTSIGSFTAAATDDHLGGIIWGGADGSSWGYSAIIDVRVDGTVASNSIPSRMSFGTNATSGTGATERLRINNTGAIYAPNLSTTASAANCFINNASSPANEIQRVTSSLRYKKDVEAVDMEIARRVLDEARPIWFRSKIAGDNNKSFYGFGAEEMAEIDPRLVSWSYLEEDVILKGGDEWSIRAGAQLVPEAVMYDRVSLLQIAALKEQVKELQDQISALTRPKRKGR